MLQLVRSLREANFKHYIESLGQLAPWMFSLDHINYARWLSVHVRDMCTLSSKDPKVFQQFSEVLFNKDVASLESSFEEVGSPFEEDSKDLFALDFKVIVENAVIQTVKNVRTTGQE